MERLSDKTLSKLQYIINELQYRKGAELVQFFNKIGFKDSYGQGFGSRGAYTQNKLIEINGSPEMDLCIKKAFSPVDFVENFQLLDQAIGDFNKYLSFDGWIVVRNGKNIAFKRVGDDYFVENEHKKKAAKSTNAEDDFLSADYDEISLDGLDIDTVVFDVIESRVNELHRCVSAKVPLAIIFHCGSILEGVLFGLAQKNQREFNTSPSAPKKDSTTKKFPEWTLADFINVAHNLGYVCEDVKKFSHSLRDFRNYIHPYEQAARRFEPTEDTSMICYQVLKAAITQIKSKIKVISKV